MLLFGIILNSKKILQLFWLNCNKIKEKGKNKIKLTTRGGGTHFSIRNHPEPPTPFLLSASLHLSLNPETLKP